MAIDPKVERSFFMLFYSPDKKLDQDCRKERFGLGLQQVGLGFWFAGL